MPAEELPLLGQAEREVAAGSPPAARRRRASPSSPRSIRSSGTATSCGALYGFDYVWEVYVPAAKRRWGYYVLPILFGDRLVGRIEPRIDRKTSTLRVIGLWWETGSTRSRQRGSSARSRRPSRPTGRSVG